MKSKWISLLVLLVAQEALVSGYRVICVYTNWAQFRMDSGKFLPEDIDPFLCTHIIYAYAKLFRNKLTPTEWNDDSTNWNDGMYDRVVSLKQANPELKILLGVGGWKMGSKDFSRMSARRASRDFFANTTVEFLRNRNFDGLAIDWQHPTKRGGRRQDKSNFSRLLEALRAAFDAEERPPEKSPLLLVAGVSAGRETIDAAYEVDKVSNLTDFLNVMAYDFHGSWDNVTGHPSQLYPRDEEVGPSTFNNVDRIMKYWVSKGADRAKLNLGISAYGRSFTLRNPRINGHNAPIKGPGVAGDFTQNEGMLAYYERCSMYYDAQRVWNSDSRVPYWLAGDQWIGGDDTESIKEKVFWTRYNGVGGVLFWALDMDDFLGNACNEGVFPLINTAVQHVDAPLPSTEAPPSTTTTQAMPTTTEYWGNDPFTTEITTTTDAELPKPTKRPAPHKRPLRRKGGRGKGRGQNRKNRRNKGPVQKAPTTTAKTTTTPPTTTTTTTTETTTTMMTTTTTTKQTTPTTASVKKDKPPKPQKPGARRRPTKQQLKILAQRRKMIMAKRRQAWLAKQKAAAAKKKAAQEAAKKEAARKAAEAKTAATKEAEANAEATKLAKENLAKEAAAKEAAAKEAAAKEAAAKAVAAAAAAKEAAAKEAAAKEAAAKEAAAKEAAAKEAAAKEAAAKEAAAKEAAAKEAAAKEAAAKEAAAKETAAKEAAAKEAAAKDAATKEAAAKAAAAKKAANEKEAAKLSGKQKKTPEKAEDKQQKPPKQQKRGPNWKRRQRLLAMRRRMLMQQKAKKLQQQKESNNKQTNKSVSGKKVPPSVQKKNKQSKDVWNAPGKKEGTTQTPKS